MVVCLACVDPAECGRFARTALTVRARDDAALCVEYSDGCFSRVRNISNEFREDGLRVCSLHEFHHSVHCTVDGMIRYSMTRKKSLSKHPALDEINAFHLKHGSTTFFVRVKAMNGTDRNKNAFSRQYCL